MFDLTNYEVEVKKTLTQKEFDEGMKKGLFEVGDIVEVCDSQGHITIHEIIFPPSWSREIKLLEKDDWEDKKRRIRSVYKHDKNLFMYMKNNNIIPENIINEVENDKYIDCIDNNLFILDKLEESIAKRNNSNL